MAKRSKSEESKSTTTLSDAGIEELTQAAPLREEEHPDYVAGRIGEEAEASGETAYLEETYEEGAYDEAAYDEEAFSEEAHEEAYDEGEIEAFTPVPGGPAPGFPPLPGGPTPRPGIPTQPIPRPFPRPWPGFCTVVSGRYSYVPPFQLRPQPLPQPGRRPVVPRRVPGPIIPINLLRITVRVDVDRYFPQKRISIQVSRLFPHRTAHAIARVISDRCSGFNNRTIRARIYYRDGNASLIPGTIVTFTAKRTTGFGYGAYKLTLSGGGITPRHYKLRFASRYFDPVEFEVDRVQNAGSIVTAYNTGSHPTRPGNLPNETLSLATVFQRAGFDVRMSPNTTVIPTSGAGANGTWSDAEMHNAMVTYWSRFANRPQWAMWVLYAARHDAGRGLGGVMFDDIGGNHRQGTAIFTDSFIQDVPPGDPNPNAWRNRMQFWTAVHEMGHAFNLAHSWQKALGVPVAPGDPWIPLANEPEARSYMNYPFRVSGGQSAFFSNFRFRFSNNELIFMRHAPRRFVQMGNSNWFENHGFEAPDALSQTGNWALEIRPNRDATAYRFLEPVTMELKLTNTNSEPQTIDPDMLDDGRHVTVFLQREGGLTRQWNPMITHCHEAHEDAVAPGESIYGAHMVSASTDGWLVDEPGFYKLQAAVDMGGEIVVSNVLRLYVGPPDSQAEAAVAPDYFTEDVGRVLAFSGAPALNAAENALRKLTETCADNPAARHAEVALTSPLLRYFKTLKAEGSRADMAITTAKRDVGKAAKVQSDALLKGADAAADTLGHIPYFGQLRQVAAALEDEGNKKGAADLLSKTVTVMKRRKVLPSVIAETEAGIK